MVELQYEFCHSTNRRPRNDFTPVHLEVFIPHHCPWIEKPLKRTCGRVERTDIAAFEPITVVTAVGQIFGGCLSTMTCRYDMINFV